MNWAFVLMLLARLFFAALFLWAAVVKIVDTDKFAQEVANYEIIGPQPSALVGAILPWLEFLIGSCLLSGLCSPGAWLGTIALFTCFVVARLSVLHRGMSIKCGCGVMDGLITPSSVAISVGLLVAAITAYVATIRSQMHAIGSPRSVNARKVEESQASPLRSEPLPNGAALIMLVALVIGVSSNIASAATQALPQTATAIRRASCTQFQDSFDRLVVTRGNDSEVQFALQRLTAMDRLTDLVLNDLRIHHAAFLNQSLATVGTTATPNAAPQPLGSRKIVEQFQKAFDASAVHTLDESDSKTLDQYLIKSRDALTSAIQSRGHACMSVVGIDQAEVIRLSFVLPILMSDTNQDLTTSPPSLPDWMSGSKSLHVLQTFAAECARPREAFALRNPANSTTAPANLSLEYLSFVKRESDALLRAGNYSAALTCIRDGVAVAESSRDLPDAIDLSFRVATIVATTESPAAAAQEMVRVRSMCETSNDFGRASLVRVKYLYQAGELDALLADVSADVKEPKCDAYLPQIIYIAWITCRQEGVDAERWRKELIERFPEDPLAAEIYFASAKDALAASNVEEASRLLKFIEYRFPQSSIIEKVRQIQKNLDATPMNPAQTASAEGHHSP